MTIILITHKLSLVRDADHISFDSEGKSHESGIHEDLMKRNGIYNQMWSVQNH